MRKQLLYVCCLCLSCLIGKATTNYYYNGTGSITSTTSWGTNTNGSGTNPSNFTTASQVFNIRNAASVTITANWTVSGSSSSIQVGDGTNACTFTIPSSFAVTGTVGVSNNGTLSIANTTIPTMGTLSLGSTVTFNGSVAQTLPGVAYANLTISNTSGAVATAGNNITISGTLTISASSTLDMGTRSLLAGIKISSSTTTSGSTAVTLGSSNANIAVGQSVYGTNIPVGTTVAAISGTSLTLSQNATGSSTTAVISINFNTAGTGMLKLENITSGSGTLAPCSFTFTVDFDGAGNQTMPNGICSFTNLTIANTGFATGLFSSISIGGVLAVSDGTTLSAGNNVISGSYTTSNNSGTGTGKLTTTNTSATPLPAGITYNFEVDYTANSNQTIVASNYANLNGTGNNRTLSSTGTVAVVGTFTPGSGTYTTTGSTFSLAGTTTLLSWTFNNLIIAGGTITAPSSLTVTGNFTINSGATFIAPSGTFTVGGNWTNAGTYTANGGAVTLNGTGQSLTGSTTFYNFTKSVSSADILTFPSGQTQTFAGMLSLSGISSGNLLSINANTQGSQATITPTAGKCSISYVSVTDNNNNSGTTIVASNTIINGDNTGWASVFSKSTDILKANYLANPPYYVPASYPSMGACTGRINNNGSFKRTPNTALQADITDTIYKLAFTFLAQDSVAYYHQDSIKPILYNSLNYWLANPPAWTFVGTTFTQITAVGKTLAYLFNDSVVIADAQGPTYGSLLTSIKTNARAFLLFAWDIDYDIVPTSYFVTLGDTVYDDHHRLGNVGYRMAGMTGIACAIGDSLLMDTINIIVNNQIPFVSDTIGIADNGVQGIAYDGSLFQHGAQFQNAGYGKDFFNDALSSYDTWTANTKWALDTTAQTEKANIAVNGLAWLSWYNTLPHNLNGRDDCKSGHETFPNYSYINNCYNSAVIKTLPIYPLVNELNTKTVSATTGGNLDSTKYFWNSHVIVSQSINYLGAIRMLSSRILGDETSDATTGQGMMNFHMADGSALIYHGQGTDYDTARVCWNWRCVPGITAKQRTGALPLVAWGSGYESNNTLAGGVSDGSVTMGAFYLNRTNAAATTKAYKSYFTFKDAMICVGNSIADSYTGTGNVYTTLNQTTFRSTIYYSINGGTVQNIPLGTYDSISSNIQSPSWYWHDSIGYIILPMTTNDSSNVLLTTQQRTGNWHNLDSSNTNASVNVNIFQLSINHGGNNNTNWLSSRYSYVVVPGVGEDSLVRFFNNRILTKDSTSLYINYNSSNIISASYNGYTGVFFMAGGNNKATALGYDSLSVSSNNYSCILMQRSNGLMNMHVSDMNSNFASKQLVKIGINRIFVGNSFTSPWADSSTSVTSSGDSTIVSACISKVAAIYNGEPVHITSLTPASVPGVPSIGSATGGNQQATVAFTAPSSNGGSSIIGYTVTPYIGGVAQATTSGSSSPIVVTGLTNGTAYTFTVYATNYVGNGSASAASASVTPATVPGAPSVGSATGGNQQVSVAFTAPSSNGGASITGYTVTPYIGGVAQATTSGSSSPIVVTGLTNGTAYTFTVYATNSVGNGSASAASAPVTPATVPDAPSIGSTTIGNQQVSVAFTTPFNEGSAITGYTVTPYIGGVAQATTSGSSSPIIVTGLTNGTAYTFTVYATNSVGNGSASAASSAVTPATVPGAPSIVSATGGNQQVSVAFTAPSSNGGAAITGYTVTSSPGGFTGTGTGSPITVTGLTNGTAYTFTVYATNVIGNGSASAASAPVTPATVPDAPSISSAIGSNQQATISFTAPFNEGAAITGYTVTPYVGGVAQATTSGSSSPIVVTGLTNGTTYTFTVYATNGVGNGSASAASSAVTPSNSYTWVGATSTNWNDFNNWVPTGLPASVAAVTITKGGSYDLSIEVSPTVASLGISAGNNVTLQNGQTLTLNGNLSNAGSFAANATSSVVVATSASISGAGTTNLNNLTINSGQTLTGGNIGISGTFTNNGTYTASTGSINFNGTTAQTIPALTYNNLSVTNTSATVTAGGNIGCGGILTIASSALLDMTTYQLTGSFTTSGTGTLNTACTANPAIPGNIYSFAVNYTAATGGQYFAGTYNNGITFSNTSGTDNAFTTAYVAGVFAITNAGSTVNMGSHILYGSITQTTATSGNSGTTITLSAPNASIVPGMSVYGANIPVGTTVSAISGTNLTLSQAQTSSITSSVKLTFGLTTSGAGTLETTDITSGSVTLPPASFAFTVEFNGAGNQTTPNGLCAFNNLIIANTGYTTGLYGNATINGVLTVVDGAILNAGSNTISGNFTTSNNGGSGTGKLTTGNTSSTPLTAGITYYFEVDYTANSSQTIVAGNYANLNGTGNNRILSSTGTIAIAGVFTAGAGTYTTTGSTVSFGSTQSLPSLSYHNLIIAGGSITAPSTLMVGGSFTLNSGATFIAPSGNLSVAGNWSNTGGTYSANNGTVILNGGSQSITGSTTFYNFKKSVTSAATLTFPSGQTQTFNDSLTLNGVASNLLTINASTPGSQAIIIPTASKWTVDYTTVSDNDNTCGTNIFAHYSTISNCSGWSASSTSNVNLNAGLTPEDTSMATTVRLYPNPLRGNTLNVRMGNLPVGKYHLDIYNTLGQRVSEQTINCLGDNGCYTIRMNAPLAMGIYRVSIRKEDNGKVICQTGLSVLTQ